MTYQQPGDGTVGKALDVLDQVAGFGRPVRFSELLTASPFPKATLFRFLQTLVSQGMLTHDPENGAYMLGGRLMRLAHTAWRQASLAPLARPFLDALSADLGETVHLAQLDGAHVLYVDKRNARVPIEMFSQAGKVGPAWCTGVGKAMLAFLPPDHLARLLPQMAFHPYTARSLASPAALMRELAAIRQNGHALDREEHEPGIICVAAPILSAQGRVLGALSLTSSTARITVEALEAHAERVKATAARIAAETGSWRFPGDMANPAQGNSATA